jgi:hypothetical protein
VGDVTDIVGALARKEFAAARAQLAATLVIIGDDMHLDAEDMSEAADPIAFGQVVHSVAGKLAEPNETWNALSRAIRDHGYSRKRGTDGA